MASRRSIERSSSVREVPASRRRTLTWHGNGQVDIELKIMLHAVVDLKRVIWGAI